MPNAELVDIYADEVDLILAATPLSTTKFIHSAMAYIILLKYMEAPIRFTNGHYRLDRVPERLWVSLIRRAMLQ